MKKNLLSILSVLAVAVSLWATFYFDKYFKQADMEIVHFFAGFIFALGAFYLLRIVFKKRSNFKQTE